jgi:SAM-dependent methyltransferase
MSPEVYSLFEQVLHGKKITGPVLEVGAVHGPDCLLNLPVFNDCSERIGVNTIMQESTGLLKYMQANANDLSCFQDHYFQVVVCNSMLEHDPLFWKTLAEIHRVTARGGLIVIGVPGYSGMGLNHVFKKRNLLQRLLFRLASIYDKDALSASTLTLGEHFFPGDYYRFSRQALQEVFFDGMVDVTIHTTMNPPRFIGIGTKP